MQVVILSNRGWHAHELPPPLTKRGHHARLLPYEALIARCEGKRGSAGTLTCEADAVLEADVVLARFIPAGSLEQIINRVDALHWIEDRGVPVVNPPRAI